MFLCEPYNKNQSTFLIFWDVLNFEVPCVMRSYLKSCVWSPRIFLVSQIVEILVNVRHDLGQQLKEGTQMSIIFCDYFVRVCIHFDTI